MCVTYGWYHPPAGVAAKPEPSGKYPEFMLFDIEQDPEEDDDISGQTGVKEVLKVMKKKLAAYKLDVLKSPEIQTVKAAHPKYHNYTWVSGWC